MKKILTLFTLVLVSSVSLAVSVYKTPSFIVTYSDDGANALAINYIGIGTLSPVYVGTSRTFTVNVINKRIANFQPNIKVNIRHKHSSIGGDGGLTQIEYHDSPDFMVGQGCEGILPIGATCTIQVTFTPLLPDPYDGSIQSTKWESLRLFDGDFVKKEFSLTGWYR